MVRDVVADGEDLVVLGIIVVIPARRRPLKYDVGYPGPVLVSELGQVGQTYSEVAGATQLQPPNVGLHPRRAQQGCASCFHVYVPCARARPHRRRVNGNSS